MEYTDEEVERYYEEFYEDVHTEFLKYGEIVNFKVCRNGAFHLRGNLYVHYKSLDSAVMAYHDMNGRYFAGKQVKCEFVSVTRWKIAICGEYMKSRLKTCSRGTACNFIHCFRNPGGDYEWADWDKPPPRFWVEKMNALFGHSDETRYGQQMEENFSKKPNKSSEQLPADKDRYHSRRSRSRDKYSRNGRSSSRYTDHEKSTDRRILDSRDGCKRQRTPEEKIHKETNLRRHHHRYGRTSDTDSAGDYSEAERNAEVFHDRNRKRSRSHHSKVKEYSEASRNRRHEIDSDGNLSDCDTGIGRQQHRKENRIFRTSKRNECHHAKLTDYKHKDGSSSRTEVYLSGGDVSDNDGTKSRHQGHKMKSSSHLEEISEVMHDYNENRSESHVIDNGERSDEDRGHYRRRKNSKSRKKASEIQDYTRYRKIKTHATDSCALMEEERYRPEETFEERYRPQD